MSRPFTVIDYFFLAFWILFPLYLVERNVWIGILAFIAMIGFEVTRYRESKRLKMKIATRLHRIPIIGPFLSVLDFIIFQKPKGNDLAIEFNQRCGPLWRIPSFPLGLLGPGIIGISESRAVEHMLKTNFENYVKGPPFYERMNEFLGAGIFNSDGTQWKVQRKVASHLFKSIQLRSMLEVFVEHTRKLSSILDQLEKSGETVDMQNYFAKFTLDSIGKIAFGCDIDSLSKENVPFAQAFDQIQVAIAERFMNPLWNIRWYRNFMPTERQLEKSIQVTNDFALDIIKKRRLEKDNLGDRYDLLSQHMMTTTSSPDEPSPEDDYYLRDVLMNYLIAGRDTTAVTLTFTTYLLSQHPEAEKKVLEELSSSLDNNETPNYDSLKDLPYLTAVINETLRLYPPVPFDPKMAVKEDTLPTGEIIPKGSFVAWTAYGMGRLPDKFPDPLKFKPERWLDENENGGRKVEPWDAIPFQAGPRTCLGKAMAYLEVKCVLSMLLPHYRFEYVEKIPPKLVPSVTIYSANGVQMKIHKRC